jgi:rubrerythrin
MTRAMLFDIEAPDYDQARAFMTPRQAMLAALSSETKAHAFFVAAIPAIQDAEVRALFEELRDEEIEHQDLVKAEIAKLPPDSPLSDEDFVDEPAPQ